MVGCIEGDRKKREREREREREPINKKTLFIHIYI